MRQTMFPHSWIGVVPGFATVLLMSACATSKSPAIQPDRSVHVVQLDQSAHFVTPAGVDVVVKPGMYRVEPGGESEIQLLPEQEGAPIVLHAESVGELSSPPDAPSDHTAMILAFEPDVYNVVLQRRGRTALTAQGSVSGIQSRGTLFMAPFREAKQRQYEAKGAIDLAGCIAHVTQTVCTACNYFGCSGQVCSPVKRYYGTITNLGNSTAGPFSATFTNSASPPRIVRYYVSRLAAGAAWQDPNAFVWGNYGWYEDEMGPRPWTFVVDEGNAVAEVNERNNTSG